MVGDNDAAGCQVQLLQPAGAQSNQIEDLQRRDVQPKCLVDGAPSPFLAMAGEGRQNWKQGNRQHSAAEEYAGECYAGA